MLSYHLLQNGEANGYGQGFKIADTNDLARIARGISRHVWSPVVWRDGRRRQDHFVCADLCVLDFDSPEMSLDEALRTFCDMAHVIGTTRNHQRDKHGVTCDRFRVVLQFSRQITSLASYLCSLQKVVARYPADPAPKDGARFFFPCKEIVSVEQAGYTEAVVEPPSGDEIAKAYRSRRRGCIYQRDGRLPRWLADFLEHGRVTGAGRNQTIYRAARNLAAFGEPPERIIDMITAAPFDRGSGSQMIDDAEIFRSVNNGISKGLLDG